jgi:hypothetical protein
MGSVIRAARRREAQPLRTTSTAAALQHYVGELAAWVQERWRDKHYDAAAFAEIATAALTKHPSSARLTPQQLLHWAATTEPLPAQDGPGNRFGEPAIRLFDNGRFFIQAIFWFDSTTSIHQHSFSGAFEVLAGSSIHSQYTFAVSQRYNEHLQFGRLELQNVELLQQGQVRAIRHGDQFIHSLFHLEHPSVSFLVRTHNDAECGPLYSYLKPGIAFNSFHSTAHLAMVREALIAAEKLGNGALPQLVRQVLEGADAEAAVRILLLYQQLVEPDEWPAAFEGVSALAQPHGSRAHQQSWQQTLQNMLQEQARLKLIVDARAHVRSSELRFFLALLLNVGSKQRIFQLIRARFARRDPLAQVVAWVGELWELTTPTRDGSRVSLLQLECEQEVKAPALQILRAQLQGKSDAAIARGLRKYRGVAEICDLWRSQPFLTPLFV